MLIYVHIIPCLNKQITVKRQTFFIYSLSYIFISDAGNTIQMPQGEYSQELSSYVVPRGICRSVFLGNQMFNKPCWTI